jgi:HD superfamily phosphodiesterase
MSLMTEQDFTALIDFVARRYESSGQSEDVIRALHGHNVRILTFVDDLAEGESLNGADYQLLKTIAVLHDAAKAETQLILHAAAGQRLAGEKLREMGKDESFIRAVERAIACHMGPLPFVEEEARKYAERTGEHLHLPRPETWVEKLFYDADMLALMDLQGIEKVIVLRSTTPEFVEEDEQESLARGITQRAAAYNSALQSVRRAAETLNSDTGRRLASRLVEDAERYVATRLASEPQVPAPA